MNSSKRIADLKAVAREKSLGKYGTLIGATLLLLFIRFFVVSLASAFIPAETNLATLIFGRVMLGIISSLLGVLVSGQVYMYMNLIYSQTINVSDIFFGFKQHPEKAVMIQGFFVIFTIISQVPMTLAASILRAGNNIPLGLEMTGIAIAAYIIEIFIQISFAPAFYLLHDFPDWSVSQILSASYRLMRGKRLKYLGLNLSFIPLFFLGAIALFIPLLWISVYVEATMAAFYQDIIAQKATLSVDERSNNGLN